MSYQPLHFETKIDLTLNKPIILNKADSGEKTKPMLIEDLCYV